MRLPWGSESRTGAEHMAVSAYERGLQACRSGDDESAVAAFQEAIDGGHRRTAGLAARAIGGIRWRHGERAAAEQAFGLGDALGDAESANLLGLTLEQSGELAAAEKAYRRGDKRGSGAAAYNFARLCQRRGAHAKARDAYLRADERGDAHAALYVGSTHERQGLIEAAFAAYARAEERGHERAAFHMAELCARQAWVPQACAAYRRAIDAGHPEDAPAAARRLGGLLVEQGDFAGAQAAYRCAIESGHPDHAGAAECELGHVLAGRGDIAGARRAYERAFAAGHVPAIHALGQMLAASSELAKERQRLLASCRSRDLTRAELAARTLASVSSHHRCRRPPGCGSPWTCPLCATVWRYVETPGELLPPNPPWAARVRLPSSYSWKAEHPTWQDWLAHAHARRK